MTVITLPDGTNHVVDVADGSYSDDMITLIQDYIGPEVVAWIHSLFVALQDADERTSEAENDLENTTSDLYTYQRLTDDACGMTADIKNRAIELLSMIQRLHDKLDE